MAHSTLIRRDELALHLGEPNWAVVDCRFTLGKPDRGHDAYLRGHIPGAVYAHLDRDLAGPVVTGRTGRHPLPDVETFSRTLSAWGIDAAVQVVAADDSGGSMAARLWWMLRWLGHDAVAVLDGGWQAWQEAGYPVREGEETRAPRNFVAHPRGERVVSVAEVATHLGDPGFRLVDARAPDRYRGENETIDPVAGHIPGALSLPYAGNLDSAGLFRPKEALRSRFRAALGERHPTSTVFYCGSGVSATHDLLAMAHAGLGDGRLFPGSWSEWIADPDRPVARGAEP